MATRAIPVVVERSRGGGQGMHMTVGDERLFAFCDVSSATWWVNVRLAELGAGMDERHRVLGLVARELGRKRLVEVVAEVSP